MLYRMLYDTSMTTGKRLLAKVRPYAELLNGVSHPYRIAIVYLLAHEPMTGQDLSRALRIKENLLAHHLGSMLRAGWVEKTRYGRHQQYSLKRSAFKALPGLITDTPFWREYTEEKR